MGLAIISLGASALSVFGCCLVESFVKTWFYFGIHSRVLFFFSIHCNQFHLNLMTSSSLLFAWSESQHLFRLERDALNFEGSFIFNTPAKPPTGFCGGFALSPQSSRPLHSHPDRVKELLVQQKAIRIQMSPAPRKKWSVDTERWPKGFIFYVDSGKSPIFYASSLFKQDLSAR